MSALVLFAAMLSSCGDDMYDNGPNEPLKLSIETLKADLNAQTVTIGITARDAAWTMTGGTEWCTISPTEGGRGISQLTVTFTQYDAPDADPRTTTLVFSSGGAQKTLTIQQLSTIITPPQVNEDYDINNAIHKDLAEQYYIDEPAKDLVTEFNQLYNQSSRDFFRNYLTHLTLNTLDRNTWATDNEGVTHSYVERRPVGTSVSTVPLLNYGMEFDLSEYNGRMVGRILYVEAGSPAARAGLKRGDWFHRVNEITLAGGTTNVGNFRYYYERVIDTLVNPIRGISPRLGMLSFRSNTEELVDEHVVRTITPENFVGTPIFGTQVFTVDRLEVLGGETMTVGYMMYNRFDPAWKSQLEDAFRNVFKPAGLDHFILDLRYNKSGSVEMAELMGNLLVGGVDGVSGRTFSDYITNGNSATSHLARRATFASHAAGLDLPMVFILTSRHTAGAAELLINALRGLDQTVVKLVVVGEVTQGLSAGMVRTTHAEAAGEWEYSAWMLACRCENDAGQSDWMFGLSPNGTVVNEWERGENMRWSATWGWKPGLSLQTQDPFLRGAVDYIRGSRDIPVGMVLNASQRKRSGLPRQFCFPTNMMME
jgi:C-terminal processing protease CtpA/Prc